MSRPHMTDGGRGGNVTVMPNQLVTLQTFPLLMEAQVVKSRLDAEGIQSFITDEHVMNLNFYSNAVGGVRLQVRAEDLERAREALLARQPALELVETPEPSSDALAHCPKCGSR